MKIRLFFAFIGIALLVSPRVKAQTTTFVSGAGNWSVGANWSNGTPVAAGNVDFITSSSSTVDNAFSMTFLNFESGIQTLTSAGGSLNVSGTTSFTDASSVALNVPIIGTGNLWLNGGTGTLTLNPGGAGLNTYSGSTQVFAGGTLTDGAANSFSPNSLLYVGGGGTPGTVNVNFNETVAGLGDVAGGNGLLNVASGATLLMNGPFTTTYSGVIAGAGGIEKDNPGTLILEGANTYTGTTVAGPGGTIEIGGGSTTGSISNSSNISGTGSVEFSRSNAYTYSGVISGGVGVVQFGAGTMTLSGNNSYTGTTSVELGTLQAGSTSAFGGATGLSPVIMNSSSVLDLNNFSNTIGSLSGAGTNSVTLGSGTLTVGTGSSNTVFAGVISGTGILNSVGYVLDLTGNNTYSGGTTISNGTLLADNASGTATGSGTITIAPTGTLQLGNSEDSSGIINGTASIVDNGSLSSSRGDNFTVANNISGTGGVGQYGNGIFTLSGTNTYSGPTTVFRGTLQAGSTSAFGGPGGLSAVSFPNAGTLDLNNFSNTVGSISGSPGNLITLGTATLTIGDSTSNTLFGGVISGTGGSVIFGESSLILSGSNTYTGGTTINSGTILSIGDGSTVGASIASSMGIQDNGTLTFAPAPSDNISYSNGISGSGVVNVQGVGTITLRGGANTYTGPTDITGGTLADGSTNTFSAGSRMIIDTGGNLAVNFNETVGDLENGSGAGTVSIASGKTLTTNGILAASPFMGIISGAGSLAINTGGSSQGLGGASTFSGGTTILGGELFVAGSTVGAPGSVVSGPVGTGTLNFAADSQMSSINIDVTLANDIVLNGTMDNDDATTNLTLSGPISGPGGITWCTPNLLELLNANSFTGGVDMREGVLLVGTDTAAGSGMMTLESAALAGYGTGMSYTISNAINITGSAVLGNMDDNNLTLTGPMTGAQNQVTYNGGPSGTLTLAADNNGLSLDTGFIISSGTVIAANNNAFGTNYVYLTGSAGLNVMNGITVANPINFSGAPNVLSGNGTIGASVTVDNTVVLAPSASPGNGPGILTFTSPLTLASGGALHFLLFDATGAAGTGYSLVSAPGGLSLTASPNTFTFNVLTTDASGNAANAINFNSSTAYNWTFANSGSAISGFSPNQFNILTGGFLNPVGGGTFSVIEVGNSLELNFTPAPEPSTWAMLAAGVFVLVPFAARRRRLFRVQKP